MEYRFVAAILFTALLADITFSTEALAVVGGLLAALTGAIGILFRLLTDNHSQRLKAMEASHIAIVEIIRTEHTAALTALKAEHSNTMTVLVARLERMEIKVGTQDNTIKEIRADHIDCVDRAAWLKGKVEVLEKHELANRTRLDELANDHRGTEGS